MSYQDAFQPASFRGVPFHVPAAETSFGRRAFVHEFPLKNVPFPEDTGKCASEFNVEGFIIGDDYIAGMKRLIWALTQPGPGTLIHPSHGTLQVSVVGKARLRERFIEQRAMVTFSLLFVEAGDEAQPSTVIDTQQVVEDACDDCYAAIRSAEPGCSCSLAGTSGSTPGISLCVSW